MSTVFRTAIFLGIAAVGVYFGSGLLGPGISHSKNSGADWESVETADSRTQLATISRGQASTAKRPTIDAGGWELLDTRPIPPSTDPNSSTGVERGVRQFDRSLMNAKPQREVQHVAVGKPLAIRNLPAVELSQSQQTTMQTSGHENHAQAKSPTVEKRPAPETTPPRRVTKLPKPVTPTNKTLPVEQKVVADLSATELSPANEPKTEAAFASTPSEMPAAERELPSRSIANNRVATNASVLPEIVNLETVETTLGRSDAIATKSGAAEVDPVADFSPVAEVAAPADEALPMEIDQRLSILTAAHSAEERAAKHIEYGKSLARRGSVFAARQELMQALRIIAESYDIQTRSRDYTDRLARGWRALQESDDFIAMDAQQQMDMNLADILETHTTQVIDSNRLAAISSIEAMQIYYAFAEDQILQAVGRSVVASDALFALGKLLTTAARFDASGKPQDRTKAMVMHQVALSADEHNHLSANELGVLLANNGRWHRSLDLFSRSLQTKQTAATWKNMAMAHEQISLRSENPVERRQQAEWAGLAMQEFDRLQMAKAAPVTGQAANWATAEQFSDSAAMPEIGNVASSGTSPARKTTAQKDVGKSLFQNVKDWF